MSYEAATWSNDMVTLPDEPVHMEGKPWDLDYCPRESGISYKLQDWRTMLHTKYGRMDVRYGVIE